MGHLLGAEKGTFLIRGDEAAMDHGGRACGILSIPAEEVSLGSPRVGTVHVQSPTPPTPPLQAFLADFSQQPAGVFSNIRPILLPGPSESPRLLQRWRVRRRQLPDPRPIPEGVREPICIRKK